MREFLRRDSRLLRADGFQRPCCLHRTQGLRRLGLLLVLAVCGSMSAQDLRYLRHQSWSTEDGLPQDSVSQIVQTSDGFLWVATEGGVARFDGVSFKVFNHASEPAFLSDDTCCLVPGEDGALWIGTADGLLLYKAGHFVRFTEREGLPSSTIRALARLLDASLLVVTAAGEVVWKDNHFSPRLAAKKGDGQDGVLHGDALQASVSGAPGLAVTTRPRSDTTWSASNTAVTLQSNTGSRQWNVGRELPGSRIETLFLDREGSAWVGTNKGLALLSSRTAEAVPVPWLQGNVVQQVFEDREGNDWIGTQTSGLHVLRRTKFRTEPGVADQEVTAVVEGRAGERWIGTRREGLRLVRNGVVTTPAPANKLTSPVVLSLAPGEDGSVWAGTPDGLNHVHPGGAVEQITSASGLPDDYIQALASDGRSGVWVGTRRGLVHLQGGQANGLPVFTRADGLKGDLVGSLLRARDGALWIGTSGGLTVRSSDGKFLGPTSSAKPNDPLVTAMAEDASGAIWVSFGDGTLSRITQATTQTLQPFAATRQIEGLAVDQKNYMWLRSRRGIDRVALADLDHCLAVVQACVPRVNHYGLADGLPSLELVQGSTPALWPMVNGELWFATRRGVAITDPAHFAQNGVPPPVAIEGFLADEVALDRDSDLLAIPFGPVRYTIEYTGLSFTVPSEVRYRYKLEGLDADWIDAGARRSATYTNLRPRAYQFRVQAMNNDGVWNETGATLAFRIVPPFYRRWWFLLLLLLCAAAFIVVGYRLRLRSLQSRFNAVLNERNRMAREIHDTLAQDFVGVSLQLDIIAQLIGLKRIDAAVAQVQQTRKLVTDGLAEARRSIWDLRANLAHDSLPTRLTETVERYTHDQLATDPLAGTQLHTQLSVQLKIELKIGGAYRKLGDGLEAEVLRIAQEALSNVQRHSGAARASVELHYGSDMLVLTIADEGKGFVLENALQTTERFGLRGMQERAAAVGGVLRIDAGVQGTTITMSSPISSAER